MRDKEIGLLLKKAEELKALFILGQRVVPFLEEIFLFIREISPILEDINTSIEDNLQKMPRASQQLSQVTEATELATTEILDVLDGLVYKADVISTNLKEMPGKKTGKESSDLIDNSEKLLESIRMDSSQIMMALQVQDITSQQLAAVNHLLQTVQSKLSKILKHFRNTELSELIMQSETAESDTNVSKMHRDIAFDHDAIAALNKEGSRQENVDSVLREFSEGGGAGGSENTRANTQEEIDALFSSSADTKTDTEEDANTFASQDDIDKLFSSGNTAKDSDTAPPSDTDKNSGDAEEKSADTDEDSDTHFSQDDIDALFNSNK